MAIKALKLPKDQLDLLGKEYQDRIQVVKLGRERIMQDVWIKCLNNYEGKEPPRTFPWPNASNAVIPIAATHADSLFARLYQAATGQDPIFLIRPWGDGDAGETGIRMQDFAEALSDFSKWSELEDVPMADIMEEVIQLMVKYGDAIVLTQQEHEEVVDYDLMNGEWVKGMPRDRLNKPVCRVMHPEQFWIPLESTDPQSAKWCGYTYTVDQHEVQQRLETGEWYKEPAQRLMEILGPKPVAGETGYYQQAGDGSMYSRSDLQDERERLAGVEIVDSPRTVDVLKIFARIDLDQDGIEEEVVMHIYPPDGIILRISYPEARHRKRPFHHFRYVKRDGVFYSIGVVEMLFNVQEILNTTMRDVLDNNKVQNTKMFLARKGGPIGLDARAYPSRIFFVDDINADFKPIDMGTGKTPTTVGDIVMMQEWGERRTGISDFNLGRERTSRTPATTTLALLEEGNKRNDITIRRMRDRMKDMWTMVMQLYAQYGAPKASKIVGAEKAAIMDAVWSQMSSEDIEDFVYVRAQVSTQNLNRSVMRQESLALFGQLQEYYSTIYNVANALGVTMDPAMRQLLLSMLRGGRQIMRQVLTSYDIKDQDDLNPEFESLAGEVFPQPQLEPAETSGSSNQVQAASGATGNQSSPPGPVNPPGRPEPGQPRVEGGGSTQPE